ncbi:hypothetical protein LCGC14_2273680, partial [marine sediment metagenome]
WEALRAAGIGAGFTDRQLSAAGLVASREDGSCYDRFRNRLIFPILDATGRVIAFGGRALAADERAKYLNSPESALFDKSSVLYALNWAREAIVSSGSAVIVEGYLDAIIPIQAGVDNVVATLGTALTDRHVRLVSRYAKEAVLIFDADTAGQAAAERALEALNHHPAFGFNYDPSHFGYQCVDYIEFLYRFHDRIFHVHIKDATWSIQPKEAGVFGGHLAFGDRRRYWDFASPGRGDTDFEEIIRALNRINYQGPLSVEWEDPGMDREHGAKEACEFVRGLDFAPPSGAFDDAFQS